jgi:sarcosine oxidase subunit beta
LAKFQVPQAGGLKRCADIVVVGGGVIGCATAFFATQAGLDTIVLERREALASLTTAASLECFRAQFTEPENVKMMLESITVFEHFPEVVGLSDYAIGIHQQGYLFLTSAPDGPAQLEKQVRQQHQMGLQDVEFLDGEEVRRRFPFVGPSVSAATCRGRDGWLSAHELTYGFAKGSSALFALQTAATGIVVDAHGARGVTTTRGEISTRCVVVAAGPFSGIVASWAGVQLPLNIIRRHKVVLVGIASVPPGAPMTIDLDTGAHWRPEAGGAIMGWALPEEPGQPQDVVPTDWTFPATVLKGVARLGPFWRHVADTLTRDNVFLSAGQYTCTPDHKPIIGPYPDVPGLYLNLGYSGHGVMGSAGGAKLLANLLLQPRGNEDNPFRYERFGEGDGSPTGESMVI